MNLNFFDEIAFQIPVKAQIFHNTFTYGSKNSLLFAVIST